MNLYHGTNKLIGKIDLTKSRNHVDFGTGFYMTDKLGTAYDWAIRKVELEGEGVATVFCYEIDPQLYKMSGLRFSNTPETAWLEFICTNRRTDAPYPSANEPRHNFNWVSGPIANDKVVDVVAEYMRKEITAESAIMRLRVLPQTHQVSLHTTEAISFVDELNVMYKQLKNERWTQAWRKRKIRTDIQT